MTLRSKFIEMLARVLHVEPPARILEVPVEVRVPAPAPPVEYVEMLQDEPGRVYVWIARPDATDDKIAAVAEDIGRRDPKALHIIVRDIAEIRKFSPEDVRRHLLPIVERCKEAGWR
ncbi:hypothetical protein DSECCO2_213240 [anaerobic digester metagenome]